LSVSQWLKLALSGVIEGQDEAAFRDRIMFHLLFTDKALDGLLTAQTETRAIVPNFPTNPHLT